MKKLVIILVIIILIVGGYFGYVTYKNNKQEVKINDIKNGWYVEVLNESVKIRKDPDKNSAMLGEAKKGDVFKVKEMAGKSNFWYFIEYEDGKYGWIANPKNSNYLNDVNNPEDIAAPTLKFFEDIYYVDSIDKITYDHLEVKDDKPGLKIEHKVYHEVNEEMNKDQYWIQYLVTDAVGKTVSKVQRIEFNNRPDESQVLDFNTLNR